MKRPNRKTSSGFTLVEMIVAVSIFGLILALIGFEFVSVVDKTLHTRANTDAEAQARLAMAKVSKDMRSGYFDYKDYPAATPYPILSPLPGASAGYVAFYHVSKGGLGSIPGTCTTSPNIGIPCPPFELVTIQMSPTTPGELDEITIPQPGGIPSSPMPLAQHVSVFTVFALSSAEYDVKITVAQPSGHCVANACTFTLDNILYVGGQK
jgi:prepilin-type N-terminal cleavage/methylation domain-containing protein